MSPVSSAKGSSLDAEPVGETRLYCEVDGLELPVDHPSISLAGLFLLTPLPPTLDAEIELFLRHGDASAHVTGAVVKVVTCEQAARTGNRPGFGLLFIHLTPAQRAFLNEVVARISGRNDGLTAGRAARYINDAPHKPGPARTIPLQQPMASEIRIDVASATANTAGPRHQVTAPFDRNEHRALIDRMRAELERQASYAPFRVLRVPESASDAEARTAYLKLSKEYHPHRYARYDNEELSELVTQVFIGYKRAYRAFARKPRRG